MGAKKTLVAIADDSPLQKYLTRKLLNESSGFIVSIEAENGNELLEKINYAPQKPAICILDIGMPVMDGYQTIEILTMRWPDIKVLASSNYHHEYASKKMIELGAKGFISKEETIDFLVTALNQMMKIGYYYSNNISKDLFKQVGENKTSGPFFTPIEKRLLSLICSDLQYNEIAKIMYISTHTVEKHKQNISKKVGIKSREGLMLFAILNDFVTLNV